VPVGQYFDTGQAGAAFYLNKEISILGNNNFEKKIFILLGESIWRQFLSNSK
jgi:hypothetical protein